jgi:hypothetical protein
MRIAISALAFGATALVALPAAAGGDNIVKQGAEAAGSTAGYMAGTVVGGPIGGAVGGVIGGAATRTTLKVIGALLPGGDKKAKAEVEAGDVQPQAQDAQAEAAGAPQQAAAPVQQIAQQPPPYLGTLAPLAPTTAAAAYANDAVTTAPLAPAAGAYASEDVRPENANDAPESPPYAPESAYPAADE